MEKKAEAPKQVTSITPDKFIAIARRLGLVINRQKTQWKVTDKSGTLRFYIPGRKVVHRIELSGFTHELAIPWEQAFPDRKSPSPKITQVVDCSQPEKMVLRDFYVIGKALVALAKEAEERAKAPAEAAPGEEEAEVEAAIQDAEEGAAHPG